MKPLIFSITLAALAPALTMVPQGAYAQDTLRTTTRQQRVEVKPEALPEKVRNAFNSKSSAGWQILESFLVTDDDNTQYYELVVRKADEQTRMKVNSEGQTLN